MNVDGEIAPAVEAILAAARERDPPEGDPLAVEARSLPESLRGVESAERVPVIAEVKPTSPTTEGERDGDPAELAREMVAGGAAVISVLTESEYFGGSPEALRKVRETVDVPVLRKDFVLSEAELDRVEADLILLIARFLGEDLPELIEAARERGFQPLVEVHTRAELETALDAGARIVGVNNRDLTRLEVDLSTFEAVAPAAPEDVILIAESGVSEPADVRRMREAGADVLLVGTAIMDGDVRTNTETLTSATADVKS